MKRCKRLLAIMLTFLLLVTALPLTVSAADALTVSNVAEGDTLTLTYMLTSPELPVLNAQVEITYSEELTLASDLEDGLADVFPVVSDTVVANHNEDKNTVTFAFTKSRNPYEDFTNGAVLFTLKFTANTDAESVSVTPDVEWIGGQGDDEDINNRGGIALVEDNEAKDNVKAEVEFEVDTLADVDGLVINETAYEDAEVGNVVYYEYWIDTDLSLVNAEIYVNYNPAVLELVDQSDAIRFPNLRGYNGLNLTTNVSNGRYALTITDIDDEIAAFTGEEHGKILVVLAFNVIALGKTPLKADTVWIGGRNENGIEEVEIDTITEVIRIEDELKKPVKVTLPEIEGATLTSNAFELEGEEGLYVNYGDDFTFIVTVAAGYDGSNMVVTVKNFDGEVLETLEPVASGTYTIKNVTETLEICVEGVVKKTFNVTLPTGEGFIVNGEKTVVYGEDYSFTIDIWDGYNAEDMTVTVTVDGKEVDVTYDKTTGTYTVKNVKGKVEITVTGVKSIAPKYMLGDVTKDGEITALDATIVLQYVAGIVMPDDEKYEYEAAKVSDDDEVTALDATYILQHVAGLLPDGLFPAERV